MSRSRDFRRRAWESLRPRYWNAFLASLIVSLIGGGASAGVSLGMGGFNLNLNLGDLGGGQSSPEPIPLEPALDPSFWMIFFAILAVVFTVAMAVGLAWSFFVVYPMQIGSCGFFIKNTREAPSIIEIFRGFQVSYKRNVVTMIWVTVKTFLWSLLCIIPGIIKAYEYAMIPYILAENPEISTQDAFAWSRDMMRGNKFRLFKLELSFIGWIFLSLFTFGIGALFLAPYMAAASAEFYMEVSGSNYEMTMGAESTVSVAE